jgi:polyhydroxybutyrate depolymerase
LSERIAAIGGVAGAYLLPWSECTPARAVPAVLFHGTADPIVPYRGGPSRAFNLPFPDVPAWVAALARRNGCGGEPRPLPARGDVSGLRYSGGRADVDFYTIAGGGHTWPGGEPIPAWIAGRTTRDIDATRVMWDFFQAHPLPAGNVTTSAGSNP